MNVGRGLAIAAAAVTLPVAGVIALAATKPAALTIRRSVSIAAAPETIFALVADLHQWRETGLANLKAIAEA